MEPCRPSPVQRACLTHGRPFGTCVSVTREEEELTKHTPGPWTWMDCTERDNGMVASTLDSLTANATVVFHSAFWRVRKGNRDLIAAAPDMLAALRGAYKLPRPWIDGGVTWPEWEAAFAAIEAAIAKAEGR